MMGMLLLLMLSLCLRVGIEQRAKVSGISMEDWEQEDFRSQRCSQKFLQRLAREPESERIRFLAVSMLMEHYHPEILHKSDELLLQYKPEEYARMLNAYEAIWSDAVCFPVATEVWYEDGWMDGRDFGGQRQHEGCDLFGEEDISGCYPIVSMTDGVVEKVGWLPLGGYRIGIRAPGGGYFYYAHLASYDREFQTGDTVSAGEILGFMGNSGYGKEGTTGKFPVHLHLGIYIRTTNYEELSVNPYWILRYVQAFL